MNCDLAPDGVLVCRFENPPVNALSHSVRLGLAAAVARAEREPAVRALLLVGSGRSWPAGADISEFGSPKASAEPTLAPLIASLEACSKPVVAALHGTVFGGGLEVALGCHFRIALQGTRLGLPEVKLGILPGAGGTQRLPRVVGVMRSLQMIVSGDPVKAREGDGIVDQMVPKGGDLLQAGLAMARSVAGRPVPRECRISTRSVPESPEEAAPLLEAARQTAEVRGRGAEAPLVCVEAVRAAVALPFEQGMAVEHSFIIQLMQSAQSRAQRYQFFAERSSVKLDGPAIKVPRVRHVGVLGAGTMGRGIAMSFLSSGARVTLVDVAPAALEAGMADIAKIYRSHLDRGRISEAALADVLGRLGSGGALGAVADCDLVVEAVVERLAVKQAVFKELDALCRPDAVLASNTSSLDIDDITRDVSRRGRCLVLHFFAPARVQRIVEVAPGRETTREAMALAMDAGRRAGKLPVPVGNCPGFVGNRMLGPYKREADALMEEGALPEQIDEAITSFGMAMGPYQISDLSGLDVGKFIRDKWREKDPSSVPRAAEIPDRLFELGRLGMKAGKGYYSYTKGSRTGRPDPEVAAVIAAHRERHGLGEARAVSTAEIRQRLFYALVNEGFKAMEDGSARSTQDIDIIWVYGYGFPRHLGGPMHWAIEQEGLGRVVAGLSHYHALRPAGTAEHLRPAQSMVQRVLAAAASRL